MRGEPWQQPEGRNSVAQRGSGGKRKINGKAP